MSFANPSINADVEHPQPSMFEGKLKGYQLKVSASQAADILVNLFLKNSKHFLKRYQNVILYSIYKSLSVTPLCRLPERQVGPDDGFCLGPFPIGR